MWRSQHLHQHIWLDDEGHPWIDDTQVPVYEVASLHCRSLSVEAIHHQFPQLSFGQIYAALSFYHDHRADMDRKLARLITEGGAEFSGSSWKTTSSNGPALRWTTALAVVGLIAALAWWMEDPAFEAPRPALAQEATPPTGASPTPTQTPAPPTTPAAPSEAPPPPPVAPNSPLPESGPHKAVTVTFNGFNFDLFFVEWKTDQVRCYYRDPAEKRFGNFGALRNWAQSQSKRLLFATNAGIFSPGTGGTPEPIPEGVFVANGQEITPLNEKSGNGNFYMTPNGVFAVTAAGYQIVETSQYKNLKQVDQATQSGPLLVLDGVINKHFNPGSQSRYVRNGVGVKSADTAVFAISRTPVNFDTFARLFHDYLKCDNALYLDGAISQMYLPAVGRNDDQGNFAGILGVMTNDD